MNAGRSSPNGPQNPPNLPPDRINDLLGMAGKQLGADPQKLKAQLEKGQLDQVLARISPQQAQQVQQVLSDPSKLESLLNSPQARAMLGMFGPKGK